MKNSFVKFRKAFTLAEVLITLVIVGVIAAMTIPTVINNTKKQEFVTACKKSYSALAQVTSQLIAENGSPVNWVTTVDDVYNMYKTKLVNIKDCGASAGCFEQSYKLLNGESFGDPWNTDSQHRKFILGDGVQVMLGGASWDISPTCSATALGATEGICQSFFVDVNGNKKPNQWGKDLFAFVLTQNGLLPAGYENVATCSTSREGYDCAARVLRENAINYY